MELKWGANVRSMCKPDTLRECDMYVPEEFSARKWFEK